MNLHEVTSTNFFQAGFLLSIMGSVLYYFKSVPLMLWFRLRQRFVYTVTINSHNDIYKGVEMFLKTNYPHKFKDVEITLKGHIPEGTTIFKKGYKFTDSNGKSRQLKKATIKNKSPFNPIFTSNLNNTFFFIRYSGSLLFIRVERIKVEHANNSSELFYRKVTISTWFSKESINNLLERSLEMYLEDRDSSDLILKKFEDYGDWTTFAQRSVKPLDKIIFDNEAKDKIIKDVTEFNDSKEWYKEVSLIYKRGYLFHGPPGTGKTTLAQSLASYSKRPICILNLASISSDRQLITAFSELPNNAVLLIEDIDGTFKGREKTSDKISITFSCLLNCIDGVFCKEGVILIITTNHRENVDPAILRPGRVDFELEMPLGTHIEVSEFLSKFYNKEIDIDEHIVISMAEVQQICIENKTNPHKAISIIESKITQETV